MIMKRTRNMLLMLLMLLVSIISVSQVSAINVEMTISQEWAVHMNNNTLQIWTNLTNIGDMSLGNISLNTSVDSDVVLVGSSVDPVWTSVPNYGWNITSLNITGDTRFNLTSWYVLAEAISNGSAVLSSFNTSYNDTLVNWSNLTDPPMYSFIVTKQCNLSMINWYNNQTNFSINVTNTGDFYMNWTQINETNSSLLRYLNSNITGNQTNQQFNITQILPGLTGYLWIVMNLTVGSSWTNDTWLFNNITVQTNETGPEITTSLRLPVGAYTSQIRVEYTTDRPNTTTSANSVFTIIGIMLIIGAILFVVVIVQKGGWL